MFAAQTKVLIGLGSVSPGLKGGEEEVVVVEAAVAVEVLEAAGGEEETDPSFLQRNLMPSWMPIMLRYVIRLHKISFLNYLDNTVNTIF